MRAFFLSVENTLEAAVAGLARGAGRGTESFETKGGRGGGEACLPSTPSSSSPQSSFLPSSSPSSYSPVCSMLSSPEGSSAVTRTRPPCSDEKASLRKAVKVLFRPGLGLSSSRPSSSPSSPPSSCPSSSSSPPSPLFSRPSLAALPFPFPLPSSPGATFLPLALRLRMTITKTTSPTHSTSPPAAPPTIAGRREAVEAVEAAEAASPSAALVPLEVVFAEVFTGLHHFRESMRVVDTVAPGAK